MKLNERKPLLLKAAYSIVFNEIGLAGDWLVWVGYTNSSIGGDRLEKLFANPATPTPRPVEPPPPPPTQPPPALLDTSTPRMLTGAGLPSLVSIDR